MGVSGARSSNLPTPQPHPATTLPPTQATDENELSFVAGDTIRVICKPHGDWWEGSCEGRSGLFPSNYVDKTFVPGTPGTDGAAEATQSNEGGELAKVLFDFTAEGESDLTLVQGEFIKVLDHAGGDGWWLGQRDDGSCGHFPSNYVELTGGQVPKDRGASTPPVAVGDSGGGDRISVVAGPGPTVAAGSLGSRPSSLGTKRPYRCAKKAL